MKLHDLIPLPSQPELDAHFAQKYQRTGAAGPSPTRRRRYGYFNPADYYEMAVNGVADEGTKWLDLGAGKSPFPDNPGLADELSRRVARFVGVDPSSNVKENPYLHEHFCGLLQDYEAEEAFNLITLRMVAEHVEDPEDLIKQLASRIEPGGLVILFTVWKYAPVTLVSSLLPFALHHPIKKLIWGGEEEDTFPTVYKMNTPSQLQRLFADHGFGDSQVEFYGDCSITGKLGRLSHIELMAWKTCTRLRMMYPESCLIGAFRRNKRETDTAAKPRVSARTESVK